MSMREETRNESASPTRKSSGGGDTVADVMTRNPQCVSEGERIERVAKMMLECDCGAVPVIGGDGRKPIGMITDRDIVVRLVAEGRDLSSSTVGDAMTRELYSVRETDSLDHVFKVMSDNKIRRVPVVDERGDICGIVAVADVAMQARNGDRSDHETRLADAVEEISEKGKVSK